MTRYLADHHAQMLRDSAIRDDIRDMRGWYSTDDKDEILSLGFREHQYCGMALMIPIFDVHGNLIETQMRPDEPRLNDQKKPVKYDRIIGAKNHLDIHPAIREALQDDSLPIILSEGSKKVDAGISAGVITIGLTGVWGFRRKVNGSSLTIPDFNHIPLNGRDLFVCYDSDAITKDQVYQAQVELGIELEMLKGSVRYTRLPDGPNGEKWGIDDYLRWGATEDGDTPEVLIERLMSLAQITPFEPQSIKSKDDKFLFYAYAPTKQFIFTLNGKWWNSEAVDDAIGKVPIGGGQLKKASTWLMERRRIHDVTWAPGEEQIIEGRVPLEGGWSYNEDVRCYNEYRPPIIDETGDSSKADPWLEHIDVLYPEHTDHMLDCFAFKIQYPGVKINHALMMGGLPGIGKDTILNPVMYAVGPGNYTEVTPTQILGRFNKHIKSVILRVSELRDMGESNRFGFYEHMKVLLASPPEFLTVDEKFKPASHVQNVCFVVYTTNHRTDGLYLPRDDRRHYVMWSQARPEDFEPEYFDRLYRWFEDGGNAHVAAFLRERDVSRFDPKAPPLKTPEFYDIVHANQSEEENEIVDLIELMGNPPAFSKSMLVALANYDRTSSNEMMGGDSTIAAWLKDRKNARALPHRIENAGYVAFRNEAQADGRWKLAGENSMIYVDATLSKREKSRAANELKARVDSNGKIVSF